MISAMLGQIRVHAAMGDVEVRSWVVPTSTSPAASRQPHGMVTKHTFRERSSEPIGRRRHKCRADNREGKL